MEKADVEALLRALVPHDDGIVLRDLAPLSGGYNSAMVRVDVEVDGRARVLTLRRDLPAGSTLVPVDRHQEKDILTALPPGLAPGLVGFDATDGSATLVLEYAEGQPLLGLAGREPDDAAAHAEALADAAARVHAVDLDLLPSSIARPTSWDAYLDDSIAVWRAAEAEHIERDPFARYAADWLERNRPEPAPFTLLHGDLQSPNVIVAPDGSTRLIDWEFSHVGDPREDLGWLQMAEQLTPPALYARDPEAFCRAYREHSGLPQSVVNPDAVAFFSILVLARPVRSVMRQISAFARGENPSLMVPYAAVASMTNRSNAFALMSGA